MVSYASQNQDSGVEPKKLGVIFSKPKLLTPEHSVLGFWDHPHVPGLQTHRNRL